MNKVYMCIDLKSFYASVECVERGLDPITTNLVVADSTRTEKTICLAISPALKKYGLPGRVRLFEVVSKVREINQVRRRQISYRKFTGKSYDSNLLNKDHNLELDYIVAPPRMKLYMEYSTKIYNIYLKFLSKEDIYVYSIDEVFCDITNYLKYYNKSPEELVSDIILEVYKNTGITATAGIGTNLYLAKVAMDIVAKHKEPDKFGVRMATLDELSYRHTLWNHEPLTDFWRIGSGYQKKLNKHNIYTQGDIALCSIEHEDLLYKLFGVNAEFLIDHAWGYEPVTIKDIKAYKPVNNCISSGQVLSCPYDYKKTLLIVREMIDLLSLDLVKKRLVTKQIVINIGYDASNIKKFTLEDTVLDRYGRIIPKPATGRISIDHYTSSSNILMNEGVKLYNRIIDKDLLIKRVNITFNVINEDDIKEEVKQFDLFNYEEEEQKLLKQKKDEQEEKELQKTIIDIKDKYGKNAILKVMNLESGGTTIERNEQIGGHKA